MGAGEEDKKKESCKKEINSLVQVCLDSSFNQQHLIGEYRMAQYRMKLHELETEAMQCNFD